MYTRTTHALLLGPRVVEGSTEALIVRHYRQATRTGFLKAFSEDPAALISGFGKLDKTLRALSLSRVHLWPRYMPLGLSVCLYVYTCRECACACVHVHMRMSV